MASIKRVVGDGRNTSFWHDKWSILNQPLCEVFPRLYDMEISKSCSVAERVWRNNGQLNVKGDWRSILRGRSLEEMQYMEQVVAACIMNPNEKDRWLWDLDVKGTFTIQSFYKLLAMSKPSLVQHNHKHVWNNWIPSKVNICIWRARMDRLPSCLNLRSRGVMINDDKCILCDSNIDSVQHLLFECPKALCLWRKLFAWWNLKFPDQFSWEIILKSKHTCALNDQALKLFNGVCYVLIWSLWKWRNECFHCLDDERSSKVHVDIFPRVQGIALNWIKWRSKNSDWNWSCWLNNPTMVPP